MSKSTAQKILQELRSQRDEMVGMLTACARLESPSQQPESQRPVLELLASRLDDLGFRCRHYSGQKSGGQLLAIPQRFPPTAQRQLLLGHADTVWPEGTLERMPVQQRDGRLYGPGVYDMKGGLVQAIFALQTLRRLQLTPPLMPIFFINTDEEIGSAESADRIVRLARVMNRAFVMEPSLGLEGRLKTARKGVGRFVVRIQGTAAHAGLDPEKGISAILESSHVVQALFALNDPGRGTTVNVGVIGGGTRPNVIAAETQLEIDVRVRTAADAAQIESLIHSLTPTVPGASLAVHGNVARPPLEATPRNRVLWRYALDAADELGISIDEGTAGGGSDGNWTSLHTATLDGLGAVGDGAHAVTEHIQIDQMAPRAALLACLMLREAVPGSG